MISVRFYWVFLVVLAAGGISRSANFSNSLSADAFVRSNAPASNYGGAGALSVSGATATNTSGVAMGIADTFIRFNTAAMVTNFDSLFGTNNWTINSARLVVVEVGSPNNPVFDIGKGAFEINWFSTDNWIEGTGTPMAPGSTGIVYTDEPSVLTNVASLGIFTNKAANSTNFYPLLLASPFVSDLDAGGDVSLYLTALDPATGFTFNSRSFTVASERPFILISAVPRPPTVAISLSGADVTVSGKNGVANSTYILSSSTNLTVPLSQWTPLATNVLMTNGFFSITATNAGEIDSPQQFFIIKAQ